MRYRRIGRYQGLTHYDRGFLAGLSDEWRGFHGVKLDTVSRSFVKGYTEGCTKAEWSNLSANAFLEGKA